MYVLLTESHESASLPMIMAVHVTGLLWINAPILFCPQPTLSTLSTDLMGFWAYIISTPAGSIRMMVLNEEQGVEEALRVELKDPRATLYEFWLKHQLGHKKAHTFRRFLNFLTEAAILVFLLQIVFSSMLDNVWNYACLFCVHFLLFEVWRLTYRPTFIILIVMLMWFVVPAMFFPGTGWVNDLGILIILISLLNTFKSIILLVADCILRPDYQWKKLPKKTEAERRARTKARDRVTTYDMLVEYLYVNFGTHLLHLYAAIMILCFFLAFQSILVMLEGIYGLHSWIVLNDNLKATGFCQRRVGYEPPETNKPPSSRFKLIMGEHQLASKKTR
jgi:hypothetical protein